MWKNAKLIKTDFDQLFTISILLIFIFEIVKENVSILSLNYQNKKMKLSEFMTNVTVRFALLFSFPF